MGETIYYIVEILIFSSMAALALFKPKFVAENILKSDSNILRIFMAIVALLNIARCFYELFK